MFASPTPVRAPLLPGRLLPLPLGAVRPLGWLLDQCRVQANGLTGRLESFWPDLGPDNMWLGGGSEGWERGPYYLDGLVALAYVLDDEELKARVDKWVGSVLTMQLEDGWIGPVQAPDRQPYDQWPVMIWLKVLTQFHEATGDERVPTVISGFCRYLAATLADRPLRDWGKHRWADFVLAAHWLYNRTGDLNALEAAELAARQGYDWRAHFEAFAHTGKTPREGCLLHTHVVNNAMAVKTGGIRYRQSGDEGDLRSVYHTLATLDRYHGQVTGMFTGDEHYAGLEPTQGTELCAVVEYMYSLEELLGVVDTPALADRLERIAYNALPGTFTPDMLAHQYDQQVNQVLCTVDQRDWTNNDDTSNTYGLEPNYGCCTANLHQGWPKLVRAMWMATDDGGLASTVLGPSVVKARAGGVDVTITASTEYPFRSTITYRVDPEGPATFPLEIRIPQWATEATVKVNAGAPEPAQRGTFHRIERAWSPGDTVVVELPMKPRVERRLRGSACVVRGPLVFSIPVGEEYSLIAGVADPGQADRTPDWEIRPTTPWNYALRGPVPDTGGIAPVDAITESRIGPVPFATPPVTLRMKARRVPGWELVNNSAAPTPQSPVTTDEPVELVELVPYGCTRLRMTELPVTEG